LEANRVEERGPTTGIGVEATRRVRILLSDVLGCSKPHFDVYHR
ncbi:unnamed protein product, partial [Musa textilis]